MIGLPTKVSSRISRGSIRASAATWSARLAIASRTAWVISPVAARVHHHVRDPAHQVLAEPDLRVHEPGRGDHLAAREIAEVARDRGRADVDREAVGAIAKARPDADDPVARVDRDGDLPVALAQRLLQALQHAQIAGQLPQLPLLAERLLQALEIAARVAPCRARRPRRSAAGPPGSISIARTSARLRTTCLWTWLSAGTSTTTSPRSCAWQLSRPSGPSRRRPR